MRSVAYAAWKFPPHFANAEIYEGDIIKGSTGKNYEVGFKNGWFLAKNGSVAILGAEMKAFEVVGNIYENPEYSDGVFG